MRLCPWILLRRSRIPVVFKRFNHIEKRPRNFCLSHLNAYLLFDAQPTRSSNCQAVPLQRSVIISLFRSPSVCRFICVHLISFDLISFYFIRLDRVHQLSSTATDSKEPNQLFDGTNFMQTYTLKENHNKQQQQNEDEKDKTNHLNSVQHSNNFE